MEMLVGASTTTSLSVRIVALDRNGSSDQDVRWPIIGLRPAYMYDSRGPLATCSLH